jgi:simple sugar transport system substrate-binding protein
MTTASPELPAAVAEEMAVAEAAIVAGTLNPFSGPLRGQDGVEKVAAGTTMTENEIKGMTWLVEGVQGTLPTG